MCTRCVCTLVAVLCAQAANVQAQVSRGRPWSSQLVVPQARSYAPGESRRARDHGRDGRRGDPRPGRDHDDGDPRSATPAGRGRRPSCWCRSPTARWSAGSRSRDPAPSPRPGCCRATRGGRPMTGSSPRRATRRCWSSPGYNLVRSSVFPVEPGGTQAVRLTYEHLLPATATGSITSCRGASRSNTRFPGRSRSRSRRQRRSRRSTRRAIG